MSGALLAQLAIVAAGALVLAVILRRVASPLSPGGSAFEAALAHRVDPESPIDEFETIRRAFDGARFSAFDVHYRLRPLLRDLAASRLRVRRGIELDQQPGPAAEVLGAEAFALLREGRPAPGDYRRPVMSMQALERIVQAMEGI
jgi:hypothetical protein